MLIVLNSEKIQLILKEEKAVFFSEYIVEFEDICMDTKEQLIFFQKKKILFSYTKQNVRFFNKFPVQFLIKK